MLEQASFIRTTDSKVYPAACLELLCIKFKRTINIAILIHIANKQDHRESPHMILLDRIDSHTDPVGCASKSEGVDMAFLHSCLLEEGSPVCCYSCSIIETFNKSRHYMRTTIAIAD